MRGLFALFSIPSESLPTRLTPFTAFGAVPSNQFGTTLPAKTWVVASVKFTVAEKVPVYAVVAKILSLSAERGVVKVSVPEVVVVVNLKELLALYGASWK